MIIKFKLFEQSQENKETLYSILKSGEFDVKSDEFKKLIGIDENYYFIGDSDNSEFTLEINERDIEDSMNIENGLISWFASVSSNYGGYVAYVDDEEYNYISGWLKPETLEKIKKFAKYLNYEIEDVEKEDVINNFLDEFGLVKFVLEEFKWEYSSIKENAFRKSIQKDIYDKTPYIIEHSYNRRNSKDSEVRFIYDDVLKYLEDNKCKDDIFTIKDLFEYVGSHECWSYELESESYSYEEGHDEIDNIVYNNINDLYNDELNIGCDKLWVELIKNDKIDLLKEKFDDVDWTDRIQIYMTYCYLMQVGDDHLTKSEECNKWFRSKEFQEKFINLNGNVVENFHILEKLKILNPEIEEEYDYIKSGDDMGLM